MFAEPSRDGTRSNKSNPTGMQEHRESALTPGRARDFAELRAGLVKEGVGDRPTEGPVRSTAGEFSPGGTDLNFAQSMVTGLREGFESLQKVMAVPPKVQNTSMIKFQTPGKFPALEEYDRDIEHFNKEFTAFGRLSNAGKGRIRWKKSPSSSLA